MPYTRPYSGGFVDYPATTTPINATALNTMDVGIKTANDQFQSVTTTERTALTPTVGQCVWDSTLKQLMVYMNASGGNAWQPIGNALVCTSTTRPSTPFEGQVIRETDTNKELTYSGSAWVQTNSWDTTAGVTGVNQLFVPPMCIVRRVAAQAVADNTVTNISFDTEDVDTDGMFAPTSTDITIKTAGVYVLSGLATLASAVTTSLFVRMFVNGSGVGDATYAGSSYTSTGTLTIAKSLAVSDVVRFAVYQTGPATSKNTTATTQLSVAWVGRAS